MQRTRADRAVEFTLLAALVVHVIALVTMAALLLPGVPGAGLPTPEQRLSYITANPMRWHLGWFPWHLCALSDLAFSAALLRAGWIPKRASVITFLLTIIPFVIEQYNELLWDFQAPFESAPQYAAFEHQVFLGVCVVAAAIYALMAMGWSWSLSYTPQWTGWLTAISWVAWPVLLFAALGPAAGWPQGVIDAGNKLGFALMTLWFILALEAILRRTRETECYGRMSTWRVPKPGLFGWLCEVVANSRFLQYAAEFGPRMEMASDIRDVVYMNYLVDAERLRPLTPEGLELQTLSNGRFALLTVLLYRHGHFGMRVLGPLRRLMFSPLQSNWRIYVQDPASGTTGVSFFANAISSTSVALVARILSRGVSMDVPAKLSLRLSHGESCAIEQRRGAGSAYDLEAELQFAGKRALPPGVWSTCFCSYEELLDYSVPQNSALSLQTWDGRLTAQSFELEIDTADCVPLAGSVHSPELQALCGEALPVCFLVPQVHFLLKRENTLRPGRVAP